MKLEERQTLEVVGMMYPNAAIRFAEDQSSSVPDFEVVHPWLEKEVIEVTRAVDRIRLEQGKATRSTPYPARRTRRPWMVWVAKHARIRKIEAKIDDYLAELEDLGVKQFYRGQDGAPAAARRLWDELGVAFGNVGGVHVTGIRVLGSASGGHPSANVVVRAALDEAFKTDNRKKLAAALANRRTLFVWIDFQFLHAWMSMMECDPPTASPRLPPEIDSLWIAALGGVGGSCVLWLYECARGWSRITTTLST